ncbi:DUF2783 domain-containing protein [Psychromarinibacter sp. C21-152]|uniref:DUF2783 domain-containing protein n=1 Tax=Psychromarinibacter sediminicola TaxID=3033385 RepID=A0AAE3T9Y4_9RHOB|nr:DUF2783 domain-containing protein [Psychromarinibacter sediminicola]MDF0603125.1 DUF2783 domain-containing protein [Psychromarinibacter sediminicola]
MTLMLSPNLENPDAFYEALTDAQRDLSDEQANDMNARLVLILANQVGRLEDLREAIRLAAPAEA